MNDPERSEHDTDFLGAGWMQGRPVRTPKIIPVEPHRYIPNRHRGPRRPVVTIIADWLLVLLLVIVVVVALLVGLYIAHRDGLTSWPAHHTGVTHVRPPAHHHRIRSS